jgi:D-lactate dehydrogenase (cytochrome)/glycolate oxidase
MTKIKYGKVDTKIIKEIENIVGEKNYTTKIEDIYCYARDASILKYLPEIVIRPQNTDQVAEIMNLASKNLIPVTPRGGGSGAAGAVLPLFGGILLDMTSMNKMLSIDIDDQMVIVEPGVIYDLLNEQLIKDGFFFPPDPSSGSSCTIGGMVNTNAAGNRSCKYGSTRDYVLWLEVVLASGEVINTGSKTLKSVSDFDLTRLMVGSEGSLGVVTKVCLKIWPTPETYSTATFIFDSVESLGRASTKVRRAQLIPEMMEFMDRKTTKLALEYSGVIDIPDGNFLLIDFGGTEVQVSREIDNAYDLSLKEKPIYSDRTADLIYREKLVTARKSALPSLARLRPSIMFEDCTFPLSKIPEGASRIEKIPSLVNQEGLEMGNYGHIADGNMHPTFAFDEKDKEQRDAFEKAMDILYKDIVLPLGGSITAEHGIGLVKAPYIELEHGSSVKWMRAIKQLFDPQFILNPGKGKGGPYPLEANYS